MSSVTGRSSPAQPARKSLMPFRPRVSRTYLAPYQRPHITHVLRQAGHTQPVRTPIRHDLLLSQWVARPHLCRAATIAGRKAVQARATPEVAPAGAD